MSLSPLAAVFVQQEKATPRDGQDTPAASAQQTQQGQRSSAPEASTSSAAADSNPLKMQTLSTIKRMLDNSILLDPWNQGITRPAQGPNKPAGTAEAPSQTQDAGQRCSGPVPAQHQLQQFMQGPPPGFGPPQHSSAMQQPYAEAPFRADVPVPQPPAGYYPYASQAPPAPPVPQLQQLMQHPQQPQRLPSYNQRLPADGAQWQGPRPPSPLDSLQQAGFFAFSPAPPPLAMYPQQQQQGPPRPPYEPAPYPGFPGAAPPGFDGLPAGFTPMPVPPAAAGGGYMPWHHTYGPPPQNENLGLFALQHLAHQRRQYRDPYYQAATNFWGAYCSTHNRFPAGAAATPAAQPRTPPPPPRPPALMQGYPMNMNAMKPRPPPAGYPASQHVPTHDAGEPRPSNLSGFGMVGRFAEYSGLGNRHRSGPQQGEAGRSAESVRTRRSSHAGSTGADADHSVLIAALPRSSSVLLDNHMRSPRVSACNPPLRKSSSCDSFQRTSANVSHASAGPGALLAVAGAAVVAAAAAAGDRVWHTDAGAASSTFTPAMLLTHDGAKPTYAAESRSGTAGGRRSSSGGSFVSGRVSNRSLAWDPMSTLSSGGGAHPSAGGAAAAAPANDGSDSGKPRGLAAKVPLVCAGSPYTPVPVMERNIWATSTGISNGGSSGFSTGLQLRPDQLEVMFRRLRADVRGPYARPL